MQTYFDKDELLLAMGEVLQYSCFSHEWCLTGFPGDKIQVWVVFYTQGDSLKGTSIFGTKDKLETITAYDF